MKRAGGKTRFKQRGLGFAAGLLLGRRRGPKMTARQLYRWDFKTGTRRMGIRFSETLRDLLRPGWLKAK